MDVERVFRMNGGLGDTSYTQNSLIQKDIAEMMSDIVLEAVQETYKTLSPETLNMADLGCSSGSNAFLYIKRLIGAVEGAAGQEGAPEFRVCLNDLPTTDFNNIFRALPDLYEELKQGRKSGEAPAVFVAVYPGSFYNRLFPANSLQFVYSFSCLHWLSKVPPGIYDEQGESLNKKSLYISENSPRQVLEAYAAQFQEDFGIFLKARSEELESGGRMVLEITGRTLRHVFSRNNTILWELLHQSLNHLVSQGKIEEEKVESFDVHFYEPSIEEIKDAMTKQSSFRLDRLEIFAKEMNMRKHGAGIARTVRAVQESMVSHHFGEEILDDLFDQYARSLESQIENPTMSITDIALVLTKL